MLCRKFELIPIKIGFFMNFLKLLKNQAKVPVLQCMVSGQISSKMTRREFSIFIIFSDANRHVLMLCRKFALIPIKIIFLRIFNLLKNQAKVPVL